MACVSNEFGFISSGANAGSKCCFLSIWSRLTLRSSYFLKPVASDTPPLLYLLVGGFLTSKGWPFNFTLTSDLVVAQFCALTTFWRPVLCSASHPAIITLHIVSSHSPLSVTYQGYMAYSQSTHYVQWWEVKESAGRKFSKAQKTFQKENLNQIQHISGYTIRKTQQTLTGTVQNNCQGKLDIITQTITFLAK